MGCMDSLACNFNPDANMANGSCEYAQQEYDCDGNITAEIGDVIEGGYLFYLDETRQRGLVAAMEDLGGSYEWGCDGVEVNGADGIISVAANAYPTEFNDIIKEINSNNFNVNDSNLFLKEFLPPEMTF